jgi:tRNA 2-thiouridine synthesizing protein A
VDRLKYPVYLRFMNDVDDTLDALGLLCPLPVLKVRKRLQPMSPGAILKLLADDPAAIVDVPHFCAEAGHALVHQCDDDGHQIYLIRKGG